MCLCVSMHVYLRIWNNTFAIPNVHLRIFTKFFHQNFWHLLEAPPRKNESLIPINETFDYARAFVPSQEFFERKIFSHFHSSKEHHAV